MKQRVSDFLQDQNGSEIVEWAVIGAMVAGIAIGSFHGPLANAVHGLLDAFGTQVAAAAEPWTTHGAAVASATKTDAKGTEVASVAKTNPTPTHRAGGHEDH